MHHRYFVPTALAAVFTAAAVAAPSASAASSDITIEVNNNGDLNALQGIVSSPRNACVGDRKVKLFYSDGGPFDHVGTDFHTTDMGRWRLLYNPKHGGPPIPSGDYKAKVTRKKLGAGVCDAATSPTIAVT